jgi:hypothetical protein
VIFVDSCAVIVIYFVKRKEKKRNKKQKKSYCSVRVLFKTKFLVELGLDILFPE